MWNCPLLSWVRLFELSESEFTELKDFQNRKSLYGILLIQKFCKF